MIKNILVFALSVFALSLINIGGNDSELISMESSSFEFKYNNNEFMELVSKEIQEENIEVNVEEEIIKPKVLIYHSHTLEKYYDYDIVNAGIYLAESLKSYNVDCVNITDNFSVVYNEAYNSSRQFLQSIDLNEYDLIIDMHRDSYNEKSLEKAMIVYTTSKNYNNISSIMNNIKSYKPEIFRTDCNNEEGINYYNQDLNENMILIEFGNNGSTAEQIKRLCDDLAFCIGNYFKNLNK